MTARRIIAILRGVTPPEAPSIARALLDAGVTRIETPLNSPDPFASIAAMASEAGEGGEIGAGTVLTPEDAERTAAAGGRFIVSPNFNPAVIARAAALGLPAWPGVLTPTECFGALAAGAAGLKLFPASLIGPAGLKAMRAVLPAETQVYAVGGVDAPDFATWAAAGCDGFGLGGSLYAPGMEAAEVARRAAAAVAAHDEVFGAPQ